MRKILFRGKRTENGEWVEGYLTRRPSAIQYGAHYSPWFIDTPPSDPDDSASFYNVDGVTVGQFTGLTDKNGTRIFEGDIVCEDYKLFCDNTLRLVDWVEASCGFEPFSDSRENCGHCGGGLNPRWVEVIGNIHDNPELKKILEREDTK